MITSSANIHIAKLDFQGWVFSHHRYLIFTSVTGAYFGGIVAPVCLGFLTDYISVALLISVNEGTITVSFPFVWILTGSIFLG